MHVQPKFQQTLDQTDVCVMGTYLVRLNHSSAGIYIEYP